MKKIFKSFELKHFITTSIIAFAYPIIKTCISNNKLLVFSDTSFIISLIFVAIGILNMSVLNGDYDLQGFIAQRSFGKNNNLNFSNKDLANATVKGNNSKGVLEKNNFMTFEQYRNIKENERKDRFNYPLFTGIIILIVSLITSSLV